MNGNNGKLLTAVVGLGCAFIGVVGTSFLTGQREVSADRLAIERRLGDVEAAVRNFGALQQENKIVQQDTIRELQEIRKLLVHR